MDNKLLKEFSKNSGTKTIIHKCCSVNVPTTHEIVVELVKRVRLLEKQVKKLQQQDTKDVLPVIPDEKLKRVIVH